MEILVGMLLTLLIEGFGWLAYRAWQKGMAPAPQAPRSVAQRANQALSDHLEATTPVVRNLRLQRRVARGARRRILENRDDNFEE